MAGSRPYLPLYVYRSSVRDAPAWSWCVRRACRAVLCGIRAVGFVPWDGLRAPACEGAVEERERAERPRAGRRMVDIAGQTPCSRGGVELWSGVRAWPIRASWRPREHGTSVHAVQSRCRFAPIVGMDLACYARGGVRRGGRTRMPCVCDHGVYSTDRTL